MRVLFIHLGREHLGIEYLSAVLKDAGHETDLAVDIGLFGRNDNIFHIPRLERRFDLSGSIIKKFREYDPGLVCFSAYTSTLQWCFRIAALLKNERLVPTVVGGPHVTHAPASILLSPDIDYGVRGEADTMIADFASRLEEGSPVEDTPGLVYKNGGAVEVNPLPDLVGDLDSLPFPDKSLFEHTLNLSDDYMTITTRGCIFNCSYCCEQAVKKLYGAGGFYRVRSVDSMMAELRTMFGRYRYREVFFSSSLFPTDKEWVAEFSDRYRREIGKPFYCFGHVNFFDEEYTALMRDAGCRNVEFGVRTLNEDVRRKVLGRAETNEKLIEALDICDRVGLRYDIDVILRLPEEKEGDYERAVRLYSGCGNVRRVKVFNLTLFPGTRIVDFALENGYIDEETIRAISEGRVGDFFHVPMVESPLGNRKLRAYENLLRLLPILPEKLILRMLAPRALGLVSRCPVVAVRFFELINLVRFRDLRFTLYLKLYARHIPLFLTGRRKA